MTSVRNLHAHKQTAGLLACVAGAVLMIWGRFSAGAPALAVPAGLALVVLGWALFAYVIVQRTRYVRAQLQNGDS
jgi:drug/metabolite transporter (DMT)-like permease